MRFSILIPHYKTGKMTAYSVAQLLKFKGNHEIEIFVIDNNPGDGSTAYLLPFTKDIKLVQYPKDRMQSHGIALNWIMPEVQTEYVITMESDSFPTKDNWLDYYEYLVNGGYDCAASLLDLSGGRYHHPCGMLLRKSVWEEARKYCDGIDYLYFPNMAMKEGFACHLMIHKSKVEEVLSNPDDYIELSDSYKPYTKDKAINKCLEYAPSTGAFHNGMGTTEESVLTYGRRSVEDYALDVLLNNKKKLIKRIGYEPGQWLSYFCAATRKKVFNIPTHTKWLDDEPGFQQEYTIMENGFYHCWGITAYKDVDPANPVAKLKQGTELSLYDLLPEHQKI